MQRRLQQPSGRPEAADEVRRLVVLAPIEPALSGNGLAMRTELFCTAAAAHGFDVQVIVVPVAGQLPAAAVRERAAAVIAPGTGEARAGAIALVADPTWRQRLGRAGVLPRLARSASPGLVGPVAAVAGRADAIHVMRAYLAPLGAAVAERLAARWVTLDLDEDEAGFAAARGEAEESSAYERLLTVFGPSFDGFSASSSAEAVAIGRRHGFGVEHVPNAVRIPDEALVRPCSNGDRSLLFVGNLTYEPNVEAATILVEQVLPRIERDLGRDTHVTLVGACDGRVARLARPGVEVLGYVAELGPLYAGAAVAVIPLAAGAGTRIKVLEAFAHRVPVVASTRAVSGLAVSDGQHLLIADGAAGTAAAVVRTLQDATLARRLCDAAASLVDQRYSIDAVVPSIRALFERADSRSRSRAQGDPAREQ
jgi:glycosyltransferase involved in cell wall biosynthesis